MLIAEIKNIKSSRSDLKKFGLTIGISFLTLGGVLFLFNKGVFPYFIALGAVFVLIGLTIPEILKPIQKVWVAFSLVFGWLTTKVILSIIFYGVVTPIGIISKIFGKHFLDLKIDKLKNTYWSYRDVPKASPKEYYEKQF